MMKPLQPEDWAEKAVKVNGPIDAYKICMTTGREFIGEDKSVVNPYRKFYKIAGDWIKFRYAKILEQ